MVQFDDEKQKRKLAEIRKVEEEDLVNILASEKYNMPSIDLASVIIENEALRYVSEKEAREIGVAPFKILGKNIHIAVKSPQKEIMEELKTKLEEKGYAPIFYMASQSSLEKVWKRYQELSFASKSKTGGLDISSETILSLGKKIKTIKDIEQVIIESAQTSEIHVISHMLEIILAGAISTKASDIHIEPEKEKVRLRFRLDGVLQDILFFDYRKYKLLNSRIKLLSGLKLTLDKKAQDGRFSIFFQEEEIGIRTSTIPGAYGESIVMRLLDPSTIGVSFNELGIEPRLLERLEKEIQKPNGLILATGPTGSGKTTTLYAFLKKIYNPEIKIITIEDPIEYHLDGITQTQTNTKEDYTFLNGLRSALRQDPDVVMVGEIRDDETAKIAIDAALTGHLVLSTLHTNNAAGVIPRLIDLGVNPKILIAALSVSIAQRLVRKLCNNCKKERPSSPEEKQKIKMILQGAIASGKDISIYNINPEKDVEILWEAVGCYKCGSIGYKGRIGIFEAILTDAEIEKIIIENPGEREINKIANKQGILNMKEDGIIKILTGITTFEEIEN